MKGRELERAQRFFLTSVSLITSYGPYGQNVMAAEWTMQISYNPMLIAVFIHEGSRSLYNIKKTKKFAVNVASETQSTLVSVAGGYSRREIDKLGLQDLFHTTKSRKTGLPLIPGCVVVAECKLLSTKKTGDHHMIVGQVVSMRHDEKKRPLIYHARKYFRVGQPIEPTREKIRVDTMTFDFFNGNQSTFLIKMAGVLVKSKKMVMVLDNGCRESFLTIPCIRTEKYRDNKVELKAHLKKMGLDVLLAGKPKLKRIVLKNKGRIMRLNFVLFNGRLRGNPKSHTWKEFRRDSFLKSLVK